MSFGLSRGRQMDVGEVGLYATDLPAIPDGVGASPEAAWLDPREWFGEPGNPFEIEIGSGKGTFLVQEAPANPGVNFLGIEWAKEFATYAMDRLRRNNVKNVKLLCGDGVEFIRWRVPSGIVRTIHLYFPDPWPKTRHHKRRTISDAFLEQAHRVLVMGGELRVVTDHADYWAWMEEHFQRWCGGAGAIGNGGGEAPGTGHQASVGEKSRAESEKLKAEIGGEGIEGSREQGIQGIAPDSVRSAPSPLEGEGGASPGEGFISPLRFERLEFTRPASAGEGEVVGTNFERKYKREGRPFYGAVLRKVE